MGIVGRLGRLLCFPVLFFYFHPTPSGVLGESGRRRRKEKGLGRSYLKTVVTGIGAPEWLGCYSADADSCGERSFRDSGPSIFPPVAPLILAVAPAAEHL